MGVLSAISQQLPTTGPFSSTPVLLAAGTGLFLTVTIFINVAYQLLYRSLGLGRDEPPLVFHWVPILGSTIEYGMEPFKFFEKCRNKYGDTFTFILLGRRTTVVLGTKGNDFILNSKWKDVSAEEIYSPLTTPVFGTDVVYDCPNSKLMEQKKFVKFGLTTSALTSYVELISREVEQYIATNKEFAGKSPQKGLQPKKGKFDAVASMSELTIYTASRSLQGKEVREKFDSTFADLYHDLDMGFSPINFMLPWAPLPHNRKRDIAHQKMSKVYTQIIEERRSAIAEGKSGKSGEREEDMIWNLMQCKYKDGTQVPSHEIAHMMIALLMAGQHSSSSTSSWILLQLAHRPDIQEELYEEQKRVLGVNSKTGELNPLSYGDLHQLDLHNKVVKETLRLHAPIHSILRKVKNPLPVPNTPYIVPSSHVLLAAPGVSSRESAHFPRPSLWEPHRWDQNSPLASTSQRQYDEEETKSGGKEDYGYGEISKGGKSPYLPFGAGRHRCIGEQFAYVQLGTVIAMLVRHFKLSAEGPLVDTDYSSLFSRPLTPALIGWERRD